MGLSKGFHDHGDDATYSLHNSYGECMVQAVDSLAFCTTLKLYESSRWKTLEPMNVKTGITLCRIDSGASLARFAISNSAWWNV